MAMTTLVSHEPSRVGYGGGLRSGIMLDASFTGRVLNGYNHNSQMCSSRTLSSFTTRIKSKGSDSATNQGLIARLHFVPLAKDFGAGDSQWRHMIDALKRFDFSLRPSRPPRLRNTLRRASHAIDCSAVTVARLRSVTTRRRHPNRKSSFCGS